MATTPDIEFERGLPASLDAERTILGAVLLDNHAYSEAASSIRAIRETTIARSGQSRLT